MSRNYYIYQNKPMIRATGSVTGKLEMEGPLGKYFDICREDSKFGMDSWEKAESEMVRVAAELALKKSGLSETKIDLVFAGDLINQCTATSFGLRDKEMPYIGLYGACSTFALALGLSGMAVNGGFAENALALSSSHFCSAERQYRFPLEYGAQRTPTAQNTVTACGCAHISEKNGSGVCITEFMPGIIQDYGISDVNNMGAAMAPAAANTLLRYFTYSDKKPDDFDMILTGDLGMEGKNILLELCEKNSLVLGDNYNDCGVMIYDLEKQDVHAGGSGCGCSAAVFCGYITELFKQNRIADILLIGTGALLNPSTTLQKETIPGIAHLVRITKG